MNAKPKRRWMRIGSMALPAVMVLAPLLALMIVGSSNGAGGGFSVYGLETYESFEHGWPFSFLTRTVHQHNTSRWAIWRGSKEWNFAAAAGNLVLLAAATAVITTLSIRRARQGRAWRLTLRECMLFVTLIGIAAGHFGWCVRRGEQAIAVGESLEALNASVHYEYCGPKWLRRVDATWLDRVLQKVPLESIRWVEISGVAREDMEAACHLLAKVDRPHEVTLNYAEVNEPVLQLVLESLTLCQPEVLDLSGLKLESFMGEPWSPELLQPLARNPRLRELDLYDTGIGDQELSALLECRHLRRIDLTDTKVTAKGVQTLFALPELEELSISETAISAELQKEAAAAGVLLNP